MPFDQFRRSPAARRSRSRTPHSQRRRSSSVETIRTNGDERSAQHQRVYGGRREAEFSLSVFRNSSGPQLPRGPVVREDGYSQSKHELLTRLAQALQENNTMNEEIGKLEERLEVVEEEIDTLTGENKSLHDKLESYRQTIEDKAVECRNLKTQLEQTSQASTSTTSGQSWRFPANLFQAPRGGQKAGETALRELQTQVAGYEKQIRDLEAKNNSLHRKTIEQARQIQSQSSEFAEELDYLRSKASVRSAKISDTEIQGEWKALGFSIRQFISSHLPVLVDHQTAHHLAQSDEFKWLPEIMVTLQSPILCPVILESWVWHFLCFRVFDSHSGFWSGDVGKTFSVQCDQIRGVIADGASTAAPVALVAQFHEWRVRSVDFISKLGTCDEASSMKQATEEMVNLLRPLFSSWNRPQQTGSGMVQDAFGIIQKATTLANLFRRSRADFQVFITRVKLPLVNPPKFGFLFDEQTMECVKELPHANSASSTPTVDLAVSPGIFKAGDGDGKNYGFERVLVKLQALCNLGAVLKQFHGFGEQGPHHGEQSVGSAGDGFVKKEDQQAERDTDVIVKKEEGTD